MLVLVLFWGYICCICLLLGIGAAKVFNTFFSAQKKNEEIPVDAWIVLGMVLLTTFLAWYSIFMPLDALANNIVLGISILSAFWCRAECRTLFNQCKLAWKSVTWLYKTAILTLSAIVLAYSVQQPEVYDSALYHAQAIEWASKYPAVPGLGNLHGRLAFNAHFFLISALFNGAALPLAFNIVIYPLNGLILALVGARIIRQIQKTMNSGQLSLCVFYWLTGLFTLFFLIRTAHSPTPDIFVAALIVYISIWFLNTEKPWTRMVLICILAFYLPTIKLSALFMIFMIVLVVPFQWRLYRNLVGLGLLILLPFVLRNIILSGYLIYPFPSIDLFSFDWKIPLTSVISEKRFIESWSRVVSYDPDYILSLPIQQWFPRWWHHQDKPWQILLAINALMPLVALYYVMKKDKIKAGLSIILLLNLLFWWKTAPDPRFAAGIILLTAALAIAGFKEMALGLFAKTAQRYNNALRLLLHSGLTISFLGIVAMAILKIELSSADLVLPRPMEVTAVKSLLRTNVPILIPVSGERCFQCPIPCAPELNERLRLRGETLEDGFMIE